jgi:hypothetical protein
MPPKQYEKKVLVKSATQGEKKKLKNDNKAKANLKRLRPRRRRTMPLSALVSLKTPIGRM